MKSSDQDRVLVDALHHFDVLRTHASGDLKQQVVIDAICMRLAAGIECLARLGLERCDELFVAQWADMWGMRNRIAHGYLLVNEAIVRQTIADDLPAIVATIRVALGAGE